MENTELLKQPLIEILEKLKEVKIPKENDKIIIPLQDYKENESPNEFLTSHQPIIFTPGILSKFLYKTTTKTIIYNDVDQAEFKFLNQTLNLLKPLEKLTKQDITTFISFINNQSNYYIDLINLIISNQKESENQKEPDLKESNSKESNSIIENIRLFLSILNSTALDKFSYFCHQVLVKYLENFSIKTNFKIDTLSNISIKNEEFKEFLNWTIKNYNSFQKLYNEAIDIFRERIGFYPIKKLGENELPFWIIQDNQKQTLTLQDINKISIDNIRPKAVSWAILRRCFLFTNYTDILGIGSSYYNFVADYIAINLLNKTIPPTITVSLSINLPINSIQTINSTLDTLKSNLNSLKAAIFNNPEKLSQILKKIKPFNYLQTEELEKLTQKIDTLIDKQLLKQKEILINQINKKENRKIKKQITNEIKQINNELIHPLQPLLKEINQIVEILELQLENIQDKYKSLQSRDYPFFFINPQLIYQKINNHQ